MHMRLGRAIYHFFFNDTATTEIYTLSLHDALPISSGGIVEVESATGDVEVAGLDNNVTVRAEEGDVRSEEHTSELQSRQYLVCRLLLEKKKSVFVALPIAQPARNSDHIITLH